MGRFCGVADGLVSTAPWPRRLLTSAGPLPALPNAPSNSSLISPREVCALRCAPWVVPTWLRRAASAANSRASRSSARAAARRRPPRARVSRGAAERSRAGTACCFARSNVAAPRWSAPRARRAEPRAAPPRRSEPRSQRFGRRPPTSAAETPFPTRSFPSNHAQQFRWRKTQFCELSRRAHFSPGL